MYDKKQAAGDEKSSHEKSFLVAESAQTKTTSKSAQMKRAKISFTALVAATGILVAAGTGLFIYFEKNIYQNGSAITAADASAINDGTAVTQTAAAGQPAPDFTLQYATGGSVSLAAFKGKPTVLVFETTNCIYCHRENADLESLKKKYEDRVTIVSVDIRESATTVLNSVTDRNISRLFLLDETGEASLQYGITGTPTHFFLDKNNFIVSKRPGIMTAGALEASINKLLES